jgi:hypothetical protein
MSYQDPPRRQRPSRYPALAQYEDNYQSYQDAPADYSQPAGSPYQSGASYQDGYSGFAGMPSRSARGQRAPWDDEPAQQTTWDTPVQQAPWGPVPGGADLPRRTSGPFFAVPDDEDEPAGRRSARSGNARGRRGLLAGGVAGFLAAAVALGVANLIAAFVRPQASPIIAVGEAFIDRTPPALKNFAVEKFGENDKNMLLLGMYVAIALIAITIGMLAWRRVGIGVAGIGLFGLFGAFVAITRPESHVTDIIPSIVGGIAGIVTIVWLVHMGTASPPGTRRRAALDGR